MSELGAGESLWTSSRLSIRAQLVKLDPTLGGLYRRGIDLCAETPVPEDAKAHLALVGHCFRELINSLPDALGDTSGGLGSGQNSESAKNGFRKALKRWHEEAAPRSPDEDEKGPVAVPRYIIAAIEILDEAERAGTGRRQRRDSITVLGYVDVDSPALKPWDDARDFFMSATHVDRQERVIAADGSTPTITEILGRIAIVEDALQVRLGAFFETLHSLSNLLDEANALESGAT
jgi:hypothetical protein